MTDPDGLTSSTVVTVIGADNLAPRAPAVHGRDQVRQAGDDRSTSHVTDADGDQLLYACCDSVRHGRRRTEIRRRHPAVRFTPNDGFDGEAGVRLHVDDQHGHVIEGTVVAVPAPANRPPVASNGTADVEAGTNGLVSFDAARHRSGSRHRRRADVRARRRRRRSARPNGTCIDAPLDAGGTTSTLRYRVTDPPGASGEADRDRDDHRAERAPADRGRPTATRTRQGTAVNVNVVANDTNRSAGDWRHRHRRARRRRRPVGLRRRTLDRRSAPASEFFGTATVSYTVQDARGTTTRPGDRPARRSRSIGLPGVPPTPQAQADNATVDSSPGVRLRRRQPDRRRQLIQSDQVAIELASIGVVNSYTYTGLINGVAHRFQVRRPTTRPDGVRGASGPRPSPRTPKPGRPASPTVAFADGQLRSAWTAPANEGSAITGYELEIGGGTSPAAGVGNRRSYTWTGLTNGVELPVPRRRRERRRGVGGVTVVDPGASSARARTRPARRSPARATATWTCRGRGPPTTAIR